MCDEDFEDGVEEEYNEDEYGHDFDDEDIEPEFP